MFFTRILGSSKKIIATIALFLASERDLLLRPEILATDTEDRGTIQH